MDGSEQRSFDGENGDEWEILPNNLKLTKANLAQRGVQLTARPKRHLATELSLFVEDFLRTESVADLEIVIRKCQRILQTCGTCQYLLGN